jgi:hypothetical protein
MKTGTKCRLKYMPNTVVILHSMINDLVAEVYHILYENEVKSDHIFPVPLSELEPINKWPKTWEELGKKQGFFIDNYSVIYPTDSLIYKNIYATKQQAESALAFAQLSQLHKATVGDWVADWSDTNQSKYSIYRFRMYSKDVLFIGEYSRDFYHLAFQTEEQAQFSLTHHRELWEKYWMF